MLQIALYQPDIAPNAATIIRMSACFGLQVNIIEPAGFAWTDSTFRRAGMDYVSRARLNRCSSWAEFLANKGNARVILLTTKGDMPYQRFDFRPDDIILLGRESSGVPEDVHNAAHARLVIPMQPGERSLNVALACAIVTSEALRQTGGYAQ